MPDPFEPVQAGQKVAMSASAETARRELLRRLAMNAGLAGGAQPGGPLAAGCIYIHNLSDIDVERFGILGIDELEWGPADDLKNFKNQQVFRGRTPDWQYHSGGRFAVLLEPAAHGHPTDRGAVVRACVSGIVPVKIDMLDTLHRFADVHSGSYSDLESRNAGSARILWHEAGTGVKWAVVLLGVPCDPAGGAFLVRVKVDGGSAGGPDADCSWTYEVYFEDPNGPWPVLGTNCVPFKMRFPYTEYVQPSNESWGLGCQDVGGIFRLLEVFEEIPLTDLVDVVTQVRHDAGGEYTQVKTRPVRVLEMGEETDWH